MTLPYAWIPLLAAALGAVPVLGQSPAGLQAVRVPSPVSVDGRLDEPAWSAAPGFDRFVETFPQDGVPVPAEYRTEAKVLYDDEFLYVGVKCWDPAPHQIVAQLSRRDTLPTSDLVQVALDPSRAGNTGFTFILNAAGVQRDTLLFGDVNSTDTWDAIWDGNARVDADGWTAEFAIPLRVLRFRKQSPEWGIHVRRVIPHTRQTLDSSHLPRNANRSQSGALVVSRFGPLTGLVGIEPRRTLELSPYMAVRLTSRPQYSDPGRPDPALLDPSADVGLDLAMSLSSSLNLNVAVNPDFGQVEADQLIQNVSTNEQFFPEKRPFFTQGLDLFQPVGSDFGAQQQLFYSRRIGLLTPILGAAKMTGSVREGTEVGLLNVLVMGAGNPSSPPNEDSPDRRWRFHLRQPFHFGPNDALPDTQPVARNYFAGVVRQQVAPGARVGLTLTSAVPLELRCTPGQFATWEEYLAGDCAPSGANAAALDWDVRTPDGTWGTFGQLTGSQALGGTEEGRRLPDGTLLQRGDLGYGFFFRAGKLGGEPFRFDINGTFLPPHLELNAMGFQPLSNYQWYGMNLGFVRPSGFGPFRSASLTYTLDAFNWSGDGRWIRRGKNHWVNGSLQLPSFDTLFINLGLEDPEFDLREIPFSGLAVQRARDVYAVLGISTDPNRPLFGSFNVLGIHLFGEGPVPGFNGWQMAGNLTWHPAPFLETFLEVELARRASGPRFVERQGEDTPADTAFFGTQFPSFLSATLRQQVVLAPRLTLQGYAQLFSGVVTYGEFFTVPLAGRDQVTIAQLAPASYAGNPGGHFSALNLNLVLRWEYRLGSTLYAVYTRSQSELPSESRSVLPSQLLEGPVTQTVLVKWSYWWDV